MIQGEFTNKDSLDLPKTTTNNSESVQANYLKTRGLLGWECPNCGYIWGPFVQGCQNCNRPNHEKYKTSTTGTSDFVDLNSHTISYTETIEKKDDKI